jgi:hypothetical protein
MRRLAAFALLVAAAGPAAAQSLADQPTKSMADLLGDAYTVVSTTGNGRPGEVVVILRREAKHYACVLSELRGTTYSEAKAKPVANPCIPLN